MIKQKCRSCKSKLKEIINLGKQPLGNAFLKKKDFEKEYFYKLNVVFCNNCKLIQLENQPDPKKMFHKNYAFFSSTSNNMKLHFKKFADLLIKKQNLKKDSFVIEIGSNDGIMLSNFKNKKINHLGIEPSANVAKVAIKKKINTTINFYDSKLAIKIKNTHGLADIIYSANVICHIPKVDQLFKNIKYNLKKKGLFVFEDPYFGDVFKKNSFDQFYDEHVFLFTVTSVKNICKKFGLELINVSKQNTHGGSMRYFIAHKGSYDLKKKVSTYLNVEKKLGINNFKKLKQFKKNIDQNKQKFNSLLMSLKNKGKHVVGYAATSKSTTVLNYFNTDPNLIKYISDTTPIKINKFSPGKHIKILDYSFFKKNYPDYAILFAWNHQNEIIKKEKKFKENGGRWILFIPKVKILK